MTRFDLSPLFRSSVGFDYFSDLLERAGADSVQNSYPPYNIEKLSENDYRITMAIAGFSKEDLDISLEKNLLTISGKHADSTESPDFLYRGIATRSFQRRFNLAENMKISGADLQDGFLKINIFRETLEADKPLKIEINAGSTKLISDKKLVSEKKK